MSYTTDKCLRFPRPWIRYSYPGTPNPIKYVGRLNFSYILIIILNGRGVGFVLLNLLFSMYMFVFLFFNCWSLYCLSFDVRFLITPLGLH